MPLPSAHGLGTIGPHSYRVEDDIFHWEPHGEVLPDHVQTVCEWFLEQLRNRGYILWRIDARGSIPLGLEARRLYTYWFAEHKPRIALAAFNASILPATMATLTKQAVRLISGHDFPMANFSREDEATAYLREHGQRFREELGLALGAVLSSLLSVR